MSKKGGRADYHAAGTDLLDKFRKLCAEAGLKVTHQRLEIFHAMMKSREHPSTEEVYRTVRRKIPTIALDTGYRTLAILEQNGLLAKLQIDSRSRYDFNLERHHHFVCSRCRCIVDLYWPAFDRMKPPAGDVPWSRIDSRRVSITGLCRKCAGKKK